MNDTLKVMVNGVQFLATPVDPTDELDGEVEAKYRLEPVGPLPPDHPAVRHRHLCQRGPNYTFYEGQEIYGIGTESVSVEWLD